MIIDEKDFHTQRGELGLELLLSGKDVIQIPPISLTHYQGENISLLVWSSWSLDNLTKENAAREVRAGKRLFGEILQAWPKLNKALCAKIIPCYLYDDYGMGSIRICELKDTGTIEWHIQKYQEKT